jgi:FkbM family methyltransferase
MTQVVSRPADLVRQPLPSGENLALNKPATQSSTSKWSIHPDPTEDARAGNDGRVESKQFFHTRSEYRPWWQVDLGQEYLITRVRLYNRDVYKERLNRFSILSSIDGRTWSVAYSKKDDRVFDQVTVDIPGECLGRYLRVRLDGVGCLHFQECEVFGGAVDSETRRRLIECDAASRVDLPEGRRGYIGELGGLFVFVDEVRYGAKICNAIDYGYYERRERGLVDAHIKPGDRVLEVGTAIGVVTMSAARIVGAKNVATFDANPDIVADAEQNFARNELGEIDVQVGVLKNRKHYRPGERVKFYVAERFWASRLNASPSGGGIIKTVDIPAFCLEEELKRTNANVMIVDIEGGEVDLLSEANLSQVRLIIMETHYWSVGERAIDAMIGSLIGSGFSIDLVASKDQVVLLRRHGA